MKRILFFSPYLAWTPHTLWEVTMAYALKQRGHTVRFAVCGGLQDCGVSPERTGRRQISCSDCTHHATSLFPKMFRQQVEAPQRSLTETEVVEIREWAESVPTENLRDACYRGLPLGEWVWPDMISYWHSLEPDLARPEVAKAYRNYLHGAAEMAIGLPRLFDTFAPDLLVTLNGTFFLHRVAVELARERGIRVVMHERGWLDNTVVFNADAFVNDMSQYRTHWNHWKDVPLTLAELHEAARLLDQRRSGVNMNWHAFSPAPENTRSLRETLSLPDGPLALLCTSSDCEGSLYDRERTVRQIDWIAQTIHWFRSHPDLALVIRIHPNERHHAEVDDRPLRALLALETDLPANVRLIRPEESISTYSLMDIASAGLSYGSTAGLEMACLGLPVIHAGIGIYKNAGFTHELTVLDDIPALMQNVMALPRSLETQRKAYRFLSRLFLGLNVPFSKVKISRDFSAATLTYQSTAELAPGRDPDLDRVTAYLLDEAELYPPPTPDQLQRTMDEEDRFFAEWAASFREVA